MDEGSKEGCNVSEEHTLKTLTWPDSPKPPPSFPYAPAMHNNDDNVLGNVRGEPI